jgi:hypothetical protein
MEYDNLPPEKKEGRCSRRVLVPPVTCSYVILDGWPPEGSLRSRLVRWGRPAARGRAGYHILLIRCGGRSSCSHQGDPALQQSCYAEPLREMYWSSCRRPRQPITSISAIKKSLVAGVSSCRRSTGSYDTLGGRLTSPRRSRCVARRGRRHEDTPATLSNRITSIRIIIPLLVTHCIVRPTRCATRCIFRDAFDKNHEDGLIDVVFKRIGLPGKLSSVDR